MYLPENKMFVLFQTSRNVGELLAQGVARDGDSRRIGFPGHAFNTSCPSRMTGTPLTNTYFIPGTPSWVGVCSSSLAVIASSKRSGSVHQFVGAQREGEILCLRETVRIQTLQAAGGDESLLHLRDAWVRIVV
jgi:hypothetical protein